MEELRITISNANGEPKAFAFIVAGSLIDQLRDKKGSRLEAERRSAPSNISRFCTRFLYRIFLLVSTSLFFVFVRSQDNE